jgi:hypothetical protein
VKKAIVDLESESLSDDLYERGPDDDELHNDPLANVSFKGGAQLMLSIRFKKKAN